MQEKLKTTNCEERATTVRPPAWARMANVPVKSLPGAARYMPAASSTCGNGIRSASVCRSARPAASSKCVGPAPSRLAASFATRALQLGAMRSNMAAMSSKPSQSSAAAACARQGSDRQAIAASAVRRPPTRQDARFGPVIRHDRHARRRRGQAVQLRGRCLISIKVNGADRLRLSPRAGDSSTLFCYGALAISKRVESMLQMAIGSSLGKQ